MKTKGIFGIVLFTAIIFTIACEDDKKPRQIIEIEKKEAEKIIPIKKHDFIADFFSSKTVEDLQKNYPDLNDRYRMFPDYFCSQIIGIGSPKHPSFYFALEKFVNDPDILRMNADIKQEYADFTNVHPYLEKAFNKYHILFPDRIVPEMIYFNSGLNFNLVALDSALAVGLDMYLGESYPFYAMARFPKYKTFALKKHFITRDAVKAWMSTEFEDTDKDFIGKSVYQGKLLFATRFIADCSHDSILFAYSGKQSAWAEENFAKLWKWMVDEKLIFENDPAKIRPYFSEGPFTSAVSKDCPPRIAEYLGYRIVKTYMEKYPETDFETLFKTPSKTIFNSSKFKPV